MNKQGDSETIVVFGATSAVGQMLARIHAAAGDSLVLIARNPDRLKSVAEDLRVRGASRVSCLCSDLDEIRNHLSLLKQIDKKCMDITKYYFFMVFT